jgi:peptidoglycan/LPS O-acetylase OafA/YrhL
LSEPIEGGGDTPQLRSAEAHNLSSTKSAKTRHFVTLDGMRGVAAIAVVSLHAKPFIGGPYLPNGSLAVDLFFMLSGFVMTHAYGRRLDEGLSVIGLLAIRFVRLSPLYFIGALLGTVVAILDIATGRWELGAAASVFAFVSVWIMMPSPMPDSGDELFFINGPRWSLFYEDVVNLTMVLLWTFFRSNRRLIAAVVVFAIVLAACMRYHHTYELGWNSQTFFAGFPRVAFPFFAGVLIYRLNAALPKVTRFANLLPLALIPIFALNTDHAVRYALVCIMAAFPLLLILGARYRPPSGRLCRFLGDVSYPLYVIHVPVLGFVAWALEINGLSPEAVGNVGGMLVLVALIAVSWLLARTYDPAVRAWLGSKVLPLVGVNRRPPLAPGIPQQSAN